MDISGLDKIYFVGIGGIGMSALARYFNHLGKEVYGYDRDKNKLTKKLEAEGMTIHYKEDIKKIPKGIDLVIYTPAIPSTHTELRWFIENKYPVIKRAEALGEISKTKATYAIAGTHGKTTTSAILSHVLTECNSGASALIGGLMTEYKSNFIYSDGGVLVTEADEYDRSFHQLEVQCTAIMSMDTDHLDIYEDNESLIEAFEQYSLKLRDGGKLFLKSGLISHMSKSTILGWNEKNIDVLDFGDEDASINVENPRVEKGKFFFDIRYRGDLYPDVSSRLPGLHNAENASVAFAMAMEVGCDPQDVVKAIGSFKGIKRRFETILEKENITIIDDYAHHPTEIKAAIDAVRLMHSDKKLTVVFQPHLYSRTNDFYEAFAEQLSKADDVILIEIYPAREEPMQGVSSEMILEKMSLENKLCTTKKELISHLEQKEITLLLILGAGDIDKEIPKIKKLYK